MYPLNLKRFQRYIIFSGFLLLLSVIPAVAGLNDLFGKKDNPESLANRFLILAKKPQPMVSLGRQTPQRALYLTRIRHRQATDAIANREESKFSDLFWEIIDGAGPIWVARYQQRIMVELPHQ